MLPSAVRISATAVLALSLIAGCAASSTSRQDEGRTEPGPAGQAPAPPANGAAGAAGAGSGGAAGSPNPSAAIALVIFGADTVRAEVARSSAERSRGLMYRETLADGTGMLFVFDDAQERSFWMQNTYVALDIAFIDETFRVLNIEQMEARTEDLHDSDGPAMYALEVPKGWFAKNGIRAGAIAKIVF
jgi:uncharacterized protein